MHCSAPAYISDQGKLALKSHQDKEELANVFGDIYRNRLWIGHESASGAGSDHAQTRQLIPALRTLIYAFDIRSIADIPCGDFHWMREALPTGINYIGGDIVSALIAENRRCYGRSGASFIEIDLTTDSLPAADLFICRDALVHLSFRHARAALAQICGSASRLLLVTTFPGHECNVDVASGQWRPLNLCRSPFDFPPPIVTLVEGCTQENGRYADKSLGLWRTADLLPRLLEYSPNTVDASRA